MMKKNFYLCLNEHQRNILRFKNIDSNIVNVDDLNIALRKGANRIILFNDTIPVAHKMLAKFDVEVELWQEGIIPFFGLSFNAKSLVRNIIRRCTNANAFVGYKPYFYNSIDTIRTAYSPEYLMSMGVSAKKILYEPDIFAYTNAEFNDAPYPLYLATDYYSEGMVKDHLAQIKNFMALKEEFEDIKIRPHPKEIGFFRKELSETDVETKYAYSSRVFGSISTSLLINRFRGSNVNFILDNHSNTVKEAWRCNVKVLFD